MQQADLFLVFTAPLEAAGLDYMVSGSVAGMVYGEPRLTNDIDLILDLDYHRADVLVSAFPIKTFYCPPKEIIVIEARRDRRGHFNIIDHDSGYKADIYLCGTDLLQEWGMAHRRRIELASQQFIWVAPLEYVILRKLEYFKEGGSEKHRLDIHGMLEVSGDTLDLVILKEWIAKLGVHDEWDSISGGRRP